MVLWELSVGCGCCCQAGSGRTGVKLPRWLWLGDGSNLLYCVIVWGKKELNRTVSVAEAVDVVVLVLLWWWSRGRKTCLSIKDSSWVCMGLVATAWVVYSRSIHFLQISSASLADVFEGVDCHCLQTRLNLANYSSQTQSSQRKKNVPLTLVFTNSLKTEFIFPLSAFKAGFKLVGWLTS